MSSEQEYPFTQDTYQTGSTRPPKNRGGLIAFLLVLVIFLCGVSTALGLMNIRLFRFLQESQETAPVSFSNSQNGKQADAVFFPLGFYGQEIPELWCVYQDLPRGIYITDVESASDAEAKGVLPGDILLQVDGKDITGSDQLTALLENPQTQSVQVVLYRDGTQLKLQLAIDN